MLRIQSGYILLLIFSTTHLFSQNEHQHLFLFKKQKVKEKIWWGLSVDESPTYEYLDGMIVYHHAKNTFSTFYRDSFFISDNRIDSIYHVTSQIDVWMSTDKKTYFYYNDDKLIREESFDKSFGGSIHTIKKYIYNEFGFLDSLIATNNKGKNPIQFIFKYECDEKGRIIQKELVEGYDDIKKENYTYNKRGRLLHKRTVYSSIIIYSHDHKFIDGEHSIVDYDYKYNKKGLVKIEYEDWNNYDPNGEITTKGYRSPNEFVYKYYD